MCFQGVAIAGHALVAQRASAATRGLHLNGINVAFGAGSFLAPSLHAYIPARHGRSARSCELP